MYPFPHRTSKGLISSIKSSSEELELASEACDPETQSEFQFHVKHYANVPEEGEYL